MSYRVKRIDPFWIRSPVVPAVAVAAAIVALFSALAGRGPFAVAAACVCGAAVFLATKPALSGVFAAFGFLAGAVTFLGSPSPGLSGLMRVLSAAAFGLFYMVLMDGVVLAVSAIYNLFSRAGLRGLSLSLEE